MTAKPYAESCDQNGPHILNVLKRFLPDQGELLEIGSGTGQHAVMFASEFPGLTWNTSDRAETHSGIQMWLDESDSANLRKPIALDVLNDAWPGQQFDAAYTANTAHIMSMQAVEAMFEGVSNALKSGGVFLTYGPFKYDGRQTSDSNVRFEEWLQSVDVQRGIRDVTWLKGITAPLGLVLEEDVAMPENNRILVWRKGNH